jgi:hypothetical protein
MSEAVVFEDTRGGKLWRALGNSIAKQMVKSGKKVITNAKQCGVWNLICEV